MSDLISYPIAARRAGGVTRVIEAGPSDGQSVLLVHGLTSRADRWIPAALELADRGYHAFAVDLPGHGFASKNVSVDHSVPGYSQFVGDVLDELSIESAHLVGTSLGGYVVGRFACDSPGRARSVTLMGSLGFAPTDESRVELVGEQLGSPTADKVRRALSKVISDPRIVTEVLVREDVAINTSPGADECFRKFLGYMKDGFNSDLLPDALLALPVSLPVHLVWGEEDKSVPVSVGRRAHVMLPRSDLVVIDGGSHTFYLEDAALFAAVLVALVDRTILQSVDSGFSYSGPLDAA